MLEPFFRTHQFLVEHTDAPVRRVLMGEVDWKKRLIGIKGSRGVGKTTFLLQYAKENFGSRNRKCLYVNMNNFFFQGHSLFQNLCVRAVRFYSSTRCSSIMNGVTNCA